tara:strand:+ start:1607 stop:2026 length:420 start_codon:yes stop_codon:yes gene_type:complete
MSSIEDQLTDEEKALLNKITDKMQNNFDSNEFQEARKQNVEQIAKDASDPEFFNQPRELVHVTNYQREIFIKLNAEISTTSEETQQLLESNTIVENFYHIPVPSGVNYVEKIDEFLEKFDNELEDIAIKINTDDRQAKE